MVDSFSGKPTVRHRFIQDADTGKYEDDMTQINHGTKRLKTSYTPPEDHLLPYNSTLNPAFGHVDAKKLEHCVRTIQKQIRIIINEAPDLNQLQAFSGADDVDIEVKREIQRNPLIQMSSILKSKYLSKDLIIFDEILAGKLSQNNITGDDLQEKEEKYSEGDKNSNSLSASSSYSTSGSKSHSDSDSDSRSMSNSGYYENDSDDGDGDGDSLPKLPQILNPHLLDRVFIHKSTLNDRIYLSEQELIASHNERLEFLGDSILNNVVTMIIYERFRHSSEGELLKIRSQLVNNKTLAEFSVAYGLNKRLRSNISDLILKQGNQKIYADVFEAYIGALAIEHKMDLTIIKRWLIKIFHWKLDEFDQEINGVEPINKNAKSDLYLLIGTAAFHPQYKVVSTGDGATKPFIIRCEMGNEVLGEGIAPSSKEAGLRAAMQALKNRSLLEKYGQIRLNTDRNESKISSNAILNKYQEHGSNSFDFVASTTPASTQAQAPSSPAFLSENGVAAGFSINHNANLIPSAALPSNPSLNASNPIITNNKEDESITKLLSSILNSNLVPNSSTPASYSPSPLCGAPTRPQPNSPIASSNHSTIFPVYGSEVSNFLPEAKNDLYAILGKRGIVPQYKVIAENEKFKGELIILNVLVAIGVDSSKKKAATRAAMALLKNKEALSAVENLVTSI